MNVICGMASIARMLQKLQNFFSTAPKQFRRRGMHAQAWTPDGRGQWLSQRSKQCCSNDLQLVPFYDSCLSSCLVPYLYGGSGLWHSRSCPSTRNAPLNSVTAQQRELRNS